MAQEPMTNHETLAIMSVENTELQGNITMTTGQLEALNFDSGQEKQKAHNTQMLMDAQKNLSQTYHRTAIALVS